MSEFARRFRLATAWVICSSAVVGCNGKFSGIAPAGGTGGSGVVGPAVLDGKSPEEVLASCAAPSPGRSPLRRLSNTEYRNTVTDLFANVPEVVALVPAATAGFPSEPESLGFRNSGDYLTVPSLAGQKYLDAAEQLAEAAASNSTFVTCANGKQDATCATSFINSFGKQVYRRPFAADDTARYQALYQKAIASGYDFKTGIEWIVFAMLQSPQFLKRNDIWNLHSHAGPVGTQNPIPPETDPYAAYTRIFTFNATDAAAQAAVQKRLLKKQSALDLVLAEATDLSSKVGAKDREKLELHMTSIRDIERALQGTSATAVPAMGCQPANLGTPVDPYDDANHIVIGELFFKISALAFACDLTRVIQFNWSGNTSNRIYANLGLTEGHHDISHQNTPDAFAKIRSIHKHLWTQNLKLYETLKATPDGDGTLWDKTLVVHWNELAQGDTHAINNNLVVFAGKADNAFRRGRYLDFANKQSFSDMLVTCHQYMGFSDVTSFGDSRLAGLGPLQGLT